MSAEILVVSHEGTPKGKLKVDREYNVGDACKIDLVDVRLNRDRTVAMKAYKFPIGICLVANLTQVKRLTDAGLLLPCK